ncbi:SAC3 domain-containing protein 1-like [Babylonia areolata]|uniref:SAC3 domain-containing protein 1-like n=1 Tax=Babylonia areolata TaxID=304850 RepID=UPI003FD08F6F
MELERESSPDVVQGSCQTMCPAAELRLRERERLLHTFEICQEDRKSGRKPRADPKRVVKAFSRPAAGRVNPSPADVRPGPILLRTVAYLFESVVPNNSTDWVQVYDFVFDRLRAVRQDAVLQALHGPLLIALLERIVRFHVYAGYRLCERPADQYDPVINDQHLLECLKQLLRLYASIPGPHPHQPLFEALYLLHNLGSQESLTHGVALPRSVRSTPLVQGALAVNMAFLQGNYVRFFRHALKLSSPLCLCTVHRHFHHMRVFALRVMCMAYSSKACQFPVATLHTLLHTDTGQLRELLHSCGLLQGSDKVSAQHVNFLKTKFSAPSKVDRCKQPELDTRLKEVDITSLLLGDESADT